MGRMEICVGTFSIIYEHRSAKNNSICCTQDAYETTNKGFAIGVLTPIMLTTGIILYIWIQVKLLNRHFSYFNSEPVVGLCVSQPFNVVLCRKSVSTQVEKGSFFERGVTLLLVFLQLYPQYRALRIIFMRSLYSSMSFFYMLIAQAEVH